MAKLNYTGNDILQKEFKSKMRGYDPIEVDEFLDNVIKDYEVYNKEILKLKEEVSILNQQVNRLTKEQDVIVKSQQEPTRSAGNVTNFDILKRLSNLEKHVFGDKLNG